MACARVQVTAEKCEIAMGEILRVRALPTCVPAIVSAVFHLVSSALADRGIGGLGENGSLMG